MVATLVWVFNVLVLAWPVSEVILGVITHAKRTSATVRDRGSLVVLWTVIALGLSSAYFVRFSGTGSIGAPPALFLSAALAFLVSGLILRWIAILTLGSLFTANVAIQPGQHVVQSGVYRHVRHPAYSGLVLAFLGVGLAFDNWLSLLVIFIPVMAALSYRIRVEENALVDMLGPEYAEYMHRTKRLFPGIY